MATPSSERLKLELQRLADEDPKPAKTQEELLALREKYYAIKQGFQDSSDYIWEDNYR